MKKTLLKIYFGGLIAVPIVLLLLPATFFDTGQSICLSVLLFDETCPGCGITRAVQHFIHFNFNTAWHFNKMVVIVVPLLIVVWIEEILRVRKRIKASKSV